MLRNPAFQTPKAILPKVGRNWVGGWSTRSEQSAQVWSQVVITARYQYQGPRKTLMKGQEA